MSRIIKCDRCGKIFPGDSDNTGYIIMGWRSIYSYGDEDPHPQYKDFDFCEDCMNQIREVVENVKKPEPELVIKKKPVPPNNKISDVDVGKIRALHNAGWSNAKIADEMGISDPTIRKYIRMEVQA